MQYVFSAKNNAGYPVSMMDDYLKAGTWPSDPVDITEAQFMEFTDYPPAGKVLGSDKNGLPCWVDAPAKTREQLISEAESVRQQNIAVALQSVSMLQLKLQAGRKLSDEEEARLNAALDNIDALEAVDTSKAPNINWPSKLENN